MPTTKTISAICCALLIALGGCSRQQSEWQKTREANTPEAYQQFLKKYPSGEFSAQAQARLKEMNEEHDWQKARDADTPEAYQAFLKQYPEGKWTEEARIRVENFTLAQTPAGSAPGSAPEAANGGQSGAPSTAMPPPAGPAPGGPASSGTQAPGGAASGNEESEPTSARSRVPAHHAAKRPLPHGKYAVQLGAFKSGRAAANKRWQHLQKEYPALFADATHRVLAGKGAGATLYRLQAVGLGEPQAKKVCRTLKARGEPCVLVRPQHAT